MAESRLASTWLGLIGLLLVGVIALAAMPTGLFVSLLAASFAALVAAWILAGRSARRAAERERRFQELLAHTAHQLRTPTATSILELDTALADPALGAAGRELVARLQTQVRAQQELVERLLAYARLERLDDPVERCPAEALMGDAQAVLAPVADAHGVALRCAAAGVVVGRRAELVQLVVILGENAIRHGEGAVSVELVAERRASVLRITNTGRNPNTNPGSGLGLELARRIVERHGGSLDLTLGAGAEARVRLPHRKVRAS